MILYKFKLCFGLKHYFFIFVFINKCLQFTRLIQIGEEFCESKSEGLQESLRKQSINYFRNYHRYANIFTG